MWRVYVYCYVCVLLFVVVLCLMCLSHVMCPCVSIVYYVDVDVVLLLFACLLYVYMCIAYVFICRPC